MARLPRVAFAVLPGLDHFVPDLVRALNAAGAVEARVFMLRPSDTPGALLAWTDQPGIDTLWFEFCWPPFPALLATTDFGGRRVVVRIHRIEAYGTEHVANTDWSQVSDVVVVGRDMATRTRVAAPEIGVLSRLHVIHNGLDLRRFAPLTQFDPYRIGWCGWFSLHKNPLLALEILHRLHRDDARYRLHVSTKGGEPVAIDAFKHLSRRLGLNGAIYLDGAVAPEAMGEWHARNGVLLSTSVYESFGYAIAEAAACGCDIAVLDNTAADEFWPEECRFACIDDAVAIIRAVRPHRWRTLVAERFALARQVEEIVALVTGAPLPEPLRQPEPSKGFDSASYWDDRYRRGGNSGAGSIGRLARFKAEIVNRLVCEHGVASVAELGCGNGDQLALAAYPEYVGLDVSEAVLDLCRARFAGDASKSFRNCDGPAPARADLALSLDVVFHLVEDAAFHAYMTQLFAAGRRLVVIYSSNHDERSYDAHVRHRSFTAWVDAHAPEWRLREHVPNRYPFDPQQPGETSFAAFFIFERRFGGDDRLAASATTMGCSASERVGP